MKPTAVQRYEFFVPLAAEHLLGVLPDGTVEMRVDGDRLYIEVVAPGAPPESEQRKGGRLAQRAAILCQEGAFQTFLGVQGKDEARKKVLSECGIESRRDLDHDAGAADRFRAMDREYEAWLRT